MNKELIKKYKKEFDHWLNEGSLLGRYNYTNIPNYKPEPWFEFVNNKWDCTSFTYLNIIINDEYVELRKALIEGKTIQIYDVIYQHEYDPSLDKYGWRDFKSFTASSQFTFPINEYRVKPDE